MQGKKKSCHNLWLSCEQYLCTNINLSTDNRSNQNDTLINLNWENEIMSIVHVFCGGRVADENRLNPYFLSWVGHYNASN